MEQSQSRLRPIIRNAVALSMIVSSAFGMTTFDTQGLLVRDLSDAHSVASVESMKQELSKGIHRSIASVRPARKKVSSPAALQMRPEWSSRTCGTQIQNGSYLSVFEARSVQTFNDRFFEENTSRALRNEYENRVLADEARDNAGLSDTNEQKSRFQAMKDFAKRAVNSISKMRMKMESAHLKQAAARQKGLREPVAVAALAASLYTGKAMSFKIADGIRLSSTTAIKNKSASLSMHLPATGLTSTVAYSRDSAFNAQLSKSITNSVSAVVNSGSAEKGSAQIVYSVTF